MYNFQKRRKTLRRQLNQKNLSALLVTDELNVTYLTGFTGDSTYLLVTHDAEYLLTDFRYTVQIEEECPDVETITRKTGVSLLDLVLSACKKNRIDRLGFEDHAVTFASYPRMEEVLSGIELVPQSNLVEQLRAIKDKQEVAAISRALDYATRAFTATRAMLRPDLTERQIANELEHRMRVLGARERAFQTIVGVGPRAALPHCVPGDAMRVADDNFVLIDWGAKEEFYVSDMTRVLITGKVSKKFERIYNTVLLAQTEAIAAIKPGVACGEIDKIARDVIADAGYGKQFGHGLGHGMGMYVHEFPRFGQKEAAILQPGMVMTVEPGIYFPNWGGVRIEDDVLVTKEGHEVLVDFPKTFEEAHV